jgi:rod shape-determining protein MreC
MNKGLIGFFSLFIALLTGALYYTNTIQAPFINALNNIKVSYHNLNELVSDNIDMHFLQASKIQSLKIQLENYENNHLIMQQLSSEINDFFALNKSKLLTNPNIELIRSISYQKFGDLNRIWLEIDDYNASKIYGLVYKEKVAGIVIPKNSKPLGLLNKDIKSSYAVYIGKKKAPGIAHGNNSKNLIIKFIPAWFALKVGDEVITSGLDNIFFKGLKVGKVISIYSTGGYQNAIVKPYYEANDPNYFYLIKQVK